MADALSEAGVDSGGVDSYPLTPPRVFALMGRRRA